MTKIKIKLPVVLSIFNVFVIVLGLACYSEGSLAFGSFQNYIVIKWISVSDFLTYDDILTGFSIKYPPDWQLEQRIDEAVTFKAPREGASETYPAGLAITSKEVAANLSLSSITQTQLNTLKSLYPDINMLESGETTFAGHPAYKIVFTATDPDQHFKKAMQIWFKEDPKAYRITYKADVDAFSKYLSTVEQMLNSFYTIGKDLSSS